VLVARNVYILANFTNALRQSKAAYVSALLFGRFSIFVKRYVFCNHLDLLVSALTDGAHFLWYWRMVERLDAEPSYQT